MSNSLTCSSFSHGSQFDTQSERIATLARDLNSSPKDWVLALSSIPGLSSHILQVLNHSYACLPRRIVSIHQAIVLLGFNTVKQLASRLLFGSSRASAAEARDAL